MALSGEINANRPDIVTKNDQIKICQLIDMSVLSDRNICLKNSEKKTKHKDLEIQISRMYKTKRNRYNNIAKRRTTRLDFLFFLIKP
jgi:hypothetical protein